MNILMTTTIYSSTIKQLLINNNSYLDTEDCHLVIKDGNDNNHAISKSQLDSAITHLQQQITLLQNWIKNSGNR